MRLYVHWPFCHRRCPYCDFVARTANRRLMREYAVALRKELEIRAGGIRRGAGLRSLYLGGGTPSTLSGGEVGELVSLVGRLFGFRRNAEISVEVNPATWGMEDFRRARLAGVNRVSIGAQSMEDGCLCRLGRLYDSEEVRRAVKNARRAGIPSVSLDLLYGLPLGWGGYLGKDLERALELSPHHLSLYALTLHPGTPLADAVLRGEVLLPDEDEVADEYLMAREILAEAGYLHYEISNFCLPGHECRHNMAYWRREEYLGVGAGAHSLWRGRRFRNRESVLGYLNDLRKGELPVAEEQNLEGKEIREERIMLGLRTSRGVPERLLGKTEKIAEMESLGLLRRTGRRVFLTPPGMLLSNAVIADLMCA
ncbi:radical SAM family heme chaperone HemW [Candidatus Solincola sp.]|nr:radical SAM family heme chaperone HemW [Actinomycetota bacterium]MDI7251617.1 radical SAM family heme chaperone HemW [Actinomycetota bacterium]